MAREPGLPTELSLRPGDPEAALVAQIAAREQAALAELYGIYRRRLARFLGRFLA